MTIRKTILALLLGISMAWIPVTGHTKSAESMDPGKQVSRETEDLLEALETYTVEQREAVTKKTEAALRKLDARIDALESRIDKEWESMSEEARQKARAGLRTLRRQRTRVAEWYGSMKSSSEEAWEQMKEGFSEAFQHLRDTWRKSQREFGDPDQKEI
jgi:flagellar motility protein MotE (MotC chaperone)